jgi:hypothetical protein
VLEGDAITGVIVESTAGREAILARRVMDATGDADIADRAGAPTVKTPVDEMQAASVIFHLAGVAAAVSPAGDAEFAALELAPVQRELDRQGVRRG